MLRSHVSGCISMRAVLYEIICARGVLHHPRANRRSPTGDLPGTEKQPAVRSPFLTGGAFVLCGIWFDVIIAGCLVMSPHKRRTRTVGA